MAERSAQQQIDTRAIELASQALGKIDSHTAECARRYGEQNEALRELRATIASHEGKRSEGFQRMYDLISNYQRSMISWRNKAYVGVIVMLLTMLGFVIANDLPWHKFPPQPTSYSERPNW